MTKMEVLMVCFGAVLVSFISIVFEKFYFALVSAHIAVLVLYWFVILKIHDGENDHKAQTFLSIRTNNQRIIRFYSNYYNAFQYLVDHIKYWSGKNFPEYEFKSQEGTREWMSEYSQLSGEKFFIEESTFDEKFQIRSE